MSLNCKHSNQCKLIQNKSSFREQPVGEQPLKASTVVQDSWAGVAADFFIGVASEVFYWGGQLGIILLFIDYASFYKTIFADFDETEFDCICN